MESCKIIFLGINERARESETEKERDKERKTRYRETGIEIEGIFMQIRKKCEDRVEKTGVRWIMGFLAERRA